jgi:phosphatidylinositol kinase/protein kinase (PI-3  family)
MERRKVRVLGQIVCQFMKSFCGVSLINILSFRILITGGTSGLVETITDAVSIHSIKKAEYARRLAAGRLGHVSLFDHFRTVGIKERNSR